MHEHSNVSAGVRAGLPLVLPTLALGVSFGVLARPVMGPVAPIAMSIFGTKVTHAAWRTKPSWAVVATEDAAIDPKLLRSTAKRIGATTVEVKGSHVVFLTQPKAVADVIDQAAQGAGKR